MFLLTKHSFFQVVTGGHYDVDVLLMDPKKNVIYKQVKKQYDSYTLTAVMTGEVSVCFSNELSTFSHKLVYLHGFSSLGRRANPVSFD